MGEIEIEKLCERLKGTESLTYSDASDELTKAGFVLDEYGGGQYGDPYAVFVHPCGVVVDMEYSFTRVAGSRDSWRAAGVTRFGWVDDPNYYRHSA